MARRRVAVFAHGLGMNGAKHGQALAAGAEAAGWELHYSRSNTCSSGIGTFLTTLSGVEACGARLADEVREILQDGCAAETDVALIGASLGGLFCRCVVAALRHPRDSALAFRVVHCFSIKPEKDSRRGSIGAL